MMEWEDTHVVIDVGPDFRQQLLRTDVPSVDALLITHEHNDHIAGLDDIRPFNFRNGRHMPVYATPRVCKILQLKFDYVFEEHPYPGAPEVRLVEVGEDPFVLIGRRIIPIPVSHGTMPVTGFRVGDFAYITDAKTIPPASMKKLRGLEVLMLNALRHKSHHSHLNLEEALEVIDKLSPDIAFLTHISHMLGCHEDVERQLPDNVFLAYDGLSFEVEDTQ